MTEVTVSKSKKYNFPAGIEIISRGNKNIILAVDAGRWIVANNEDELEMFRCLRSCLSVGDLLERWIGRRSAVLDFLSEIEGRHFDAPIQTVEELAKHFAMRVYLTHRCNMRCPHCFLSAGCALNNELLESEIVELVDGVAKRGCTKLILTGGEPLLHPGFLRIVRKAKEFGLKVQVLSNGVLWKEDVISQAAPYVDEVQISIDGFDEKTNALIRGKGSFDLALRAVEGLLSCGVFVNLSITPPPHLFESCFENYLSFGRSLLRRVNTANFEVVFTDELYDGRDGRVSNETKVRYSKLVSQMHEELYGDYEYKVFVRKHEYNSICVNCGFANLTVDSDGEVYYCSRINEVLPHGNIRSESIDAILDMRRNARIATSVKHVLPCRDCNLRFVCGGGCRLSNFTGLRECEKIGCDPSCRMVRKCTPEYKDQILDFMISADDQLCF